MRILFAAHDKGGSEAIFPVVLELDKDENNKILFLIEGVGKDLFSKNKFPIEDTEKLCDEDISEKILNFKPEVVVTGTSLGPTIERKVLKFAKENEIPSVCIIDYWSNYWQRFSDGGGSLYLPDIICVIDELMKKEIVNGGVDEKKIEVTGNPHFDSFVNKIDHEIIKNQLLFIEQPMADITKYGIKTKYSEFDVLKDVIEIVKEINLLGNNYYVLLRLHPRTNKENYSLILKENYPILKLDENNDLHKSISESRLVIGMSSVVLFQAFLGGKEVVSYQPNTNQDIDGSILNKLNLVKSIYNKLDLKKVLTKKLSNGLLIKKDDGLTKKYTQNTSTLKVIDVIKKVKSLKSFI